MLLLLICLLLVAAASCFAGNEVVAHVAAGSLVVVVVTVVTPCRGVVGLVHALCLLPNELETDNTCDLPSVSPSSFPFLRPFLFVCVLLFYGAHMER